MPCCICCCILPICCFCAADLFCLSCVRHSSCWWKRDEVSEGSVTSRPCFKCHFVVLLDFNEVCQLEEATYHHHRAVLLAHQWNGDQRNTLWYLLLPLIRCLLSTYSDTEIFLSCRNIVTTSCLFTCGGFFLRVCAQHSCQSVVCTSLPPHILSTPDKRPHNKVWQPTTNIWTVNTFLTVPWVDVSGSKVSLHT